MPRLKIWIGSTEEGRRLAEAVLHHLDGEAEYECDIWSQDTFTFGDNTLEALESTAAMADFAILCVTPDDLTESRARKQQSPRDNVVFELGLFIGALGRGRAIAFHDQSIDLKLPSDLSGIHLARFRRDDGEALTRSVRAKCNEIKRHAERLGPRNRPLVHSRRVTLVLERGDTHSLDFAADSVLYLGQSRHNAAVELEKCIASGVAIPSKYLYLTHAGSRHWIELCNKRSYTFYRDSLKMMGRVSTQIAAEVGKNGTTEFDFISMGSGDGRKDLHLLKALNSRLEPGEITYYYPIDISDSLIIESIRNATGGGLRSDHVKLKAILGDFGEMQRLAMIYEDRAQPNIFSVLGNTFGNADELGIMNVISGSMREGDFTLIEINIGSVNDTLAAANGVAYMEHDFTPLAALNVDFDPSMMRYTSEDDQSVFQGTRSVMARYAEVRRGRNQYSDICLSVVHHYEFDSFVDEIADRMGVEVIWQHRDGNNGLVLARR